MTIKENLLFTVPDATDHEINEALEMANAVRFIEKNLPDGINAQVGVGGGKLSGGQKQRVAIARTILRKPKVLLLDETTPALDGESERSVQEAIDNYRVKGKQTVLVVAHRLSTIRAANEIVVIKKGQIKE